MVKMITEEQKTKLKDRKNPARYWWYVTFVNPNIEPSKGYGIKKVGKIYGSNNKKQAWLLGTDGNFHREEEYHSRILIEGCKLGEPWLDTLEKMFVFEKKIENKKEITI